MGLVFSVKCRKLAVGMQLKHLPRLIRHKVVTTVPMRCVFYTGTPGSVSGQYLLLFRIENFAQL